MPARATYMADLTTWVASDVGEDRGGTWKCDVLGEGKAVGPNVLWSKHPLTLQGRVSATYHSLNWDRSLLTR